MVKGGSTKDTRVISVRVPATVYSIIERRAKNRGMSVGDWVKRVIIVEKAHDLAPRERTVLMLRFGLTDGRTRTLEEVGAEFGVTGERIRQIEAEALRKLHYLC